jgi:hypothetical protein
MPSSFYWVQVSNIFELSFLGSAWPFFYNYALNFKDGNIVDGTWIIHAILSLDSFSGLNKIVRGLLLMNIIEDQELEKGHATHQGVPYRQGYARPSSGNTLFLWPASFLEVLFCAGVSPSLHRIHFFNWTWFPWGLGPKVRGIRNMKDHICTRYEAWATAVFYDKQQEILRIFNSSKIPGHDAAVDTNPQGVGASLEELLEPLLQFHPLFCLRLRPDI